MKPEYCAKCKKSILIYKNRGYVYYLNTVWHSRCVPRNKYEKYSRKVNVKKIK